MSSDNNTEPKILAAEIVIDRAEGPSEECGPRTFITWAGAEHYLRNAAKTAPAKGGYDKCDVQIAWKDGSETAMRFDLQRRHAESSGFFPSEVRAHVRFFAGLARPDHMTAAQYETILAQLSAARFTALRHIAERCAFTDDVPNPGSETVEQAIVRIFTDRAELKHPIELPGLKIEHVHPADMATEDTLIGEAVIAGRSFHVELISVHDVPISAGTNAEAWHDDMSVQEGTRDPLGRLDSVSAAHSCAEALSTIELPGLPGHWVMLIYPFAA